VVGYLGGGFLGGGFRRTATLKAPCRFEVYYASTQSNEPTTARPKIAKKQLPSKNSIIIALTLTRILFSSTSSLRLTLEVLPAFFTITSFRLFIFLLRQSRLFSRVLY